MLLKRWHAKEQRTVTGPHEAYRFVVRCLAELDRIDREREHFFVIGLNVKKRPVYAELVAIGSLDAAIVHPREVFRRAVAEGVASLLLAHTHPSGDPTPSVQDRALTERLARAGELLGIDVVDHIVVGHSQYHSFRENGGWTS